MPPVDDRHAELLPAKLTRAAQRTFWVLIVLDGKADPGNVSERQRKEPVWQIPVLFYHIGTSLNFLYGLE